MKTHQPIPLLSKVQNDEKNKQTHKKLKMQKSVLALNEKIYNKFQYTNPFIASCENAITLSVPGVPASCEKFPHSSQLKNFFTKLLIY
jgi:hypothetical protein